MSKLVHRRLRAPLEDGAAVIDPPVDQCAELIAHNQDLARQYDDISGVPFSKWRRAAQQDLAEICRAQTRADWPLGIPQPSKLQPPTVDQPFILSGHQPELFHPGVWLKNYLLSAIGQRVGGAAINLIIDN